MEGAAGPAYPRASMEDPGPTWEGMNRLLAAVQAAKPDLPPRVQNTAPDRAHNGNVAPDSEPDLPWLINILSHKRAMVHAFTSLAQQGVVDVHKTFDFM